MSGYNEYSDLFDGEGRERQEGNGLRKQLEEVLAANRKLMERIEAQERTQTVTNLLSEMGKDPAAAALVPKDEDPKAWLEANGKFLANTAKEEPKVEAPAGNAAPEVPDASLEEERLAMETLQGLSSDTGIPSTATADPIAKMKGFQTEEELLAYIKSNGAVS